MSDHRANRTSLQRIVLVDDEEVLVSSLANRIRKWRRDFIVETATNGYDALSLLKAAPASLLITDISMEGMQGTELIMIARRLFPELPVVVITAYPTADLVQNLKQGSIAYLEKPFEFEALLGAIEDALERQLEGFSGAVSVQTLSDVVQLYALSSTTGSLCVRHMGTDSFVWFDRGDVVHASTNTLAGAEAFYEIMSWTSGEFTMKAGEKAPRRSIAMSWAELLMESCRLMDERRHQRSRSSSNGASEGWNQADTSGLSLLAPSPVGIDTAVVPTTDGSDHLVVDIVFGGANASSEEKTMDYKSAINALTGIDGFIGAAIVDIESGMLLAQEGGGPVNLEVAGASNSEVVRAKRKAMKSLNIKDDIEDILITLGKQYHMIRPLKARQSLFFYVVLDRHRANLALARITLADVEKELSS